MADPVDADTVFQVASLSKAVSSTVVAAIVTGGTATWDSRIADIDPTFQLFDAYPTANVTIRDLFAHRSGLPGDAGNELEELGFDRDTILHRLRLVPPSSSFRSAFSYSNFGLTEGGVAAAKTTGRSWESVSEELLFKPLGMTSSSYRYSDFVSRPNRATLHAWYQGRWQALTKRLPDPQAPAGGVSSSVRDLAQWMRLELAGGAFDGKQLIAADAIAATHVPLMERGNNEVSGVPEFYGLGWDINYSRHGVTWRHAGAFSAGARTVGILLPESDLGIVVVANAFPTGVPEAVAETFLDLVFEGEPSRDWLKGWNAYFSGLFPVIEAAKATYGTRPASPVAGARPVGVCRHLCQRLFGRGGGGGNGRGPGRQARTGWGEDASADALRPRPFPLLSHAGMARPAGGGDVRDRARPEGDPSHLRRSQRARPRHISPRCALASDRAPYQAPVFGIEAHGSCAGFGPPFCRISTEMLSGERTKAMLPSRGGRLMVTPAFWSLSQKA